jgi:type IV conjugative transfer system protein TraE
MYKKILFQNLAKISKQRDLFLFLTIISLISNICLAAKIIISDEKILMVPGIKQDMWLSNNAISPSYLEEISLLFLSNLLDISANDVSHKRSIILKYSITNDPESIKAIQEYFADAEEKYKKFDLSTYFTVKEMQVDTVSLQVIANGVLTSSYGKKGSSIKDESYLLEFDYISGHLRLKSFSRIIMENI